MIRRLLAALPAAARELASDLVRALVFDDAALAEWYRAEAAGPRAIFFRVEHRAVRGK